MSFTFDPQAYNTSARGTRVYWMVTRLRSETPNGQYKIERLGGGMWSLTHEQVIQGGRAKLVRHIGPADTRTKAIRLAEIDDMHLEENVLQAMLKGHGLVLA